MEIIAEFASKLADNVEKVIIGKREVIHMAIIALLCDGHLLLEDVPGTGKTMLARSLALSLGVDFKRLQCTPDLLPNDVTGVSIYNQSEQAFSFIPGPAFTNVLLCDEINRATPRTQSALLESMGERQITVDGTTYSLKRPFFVIATQNPIEYEGTFPLPEAQLDRFMMKIRLGYLDNQLESRMLVNLGKEHPVENLNQVVDGYQIPELARRIWDVNVDQTVRDYIVQLVVATREHPSLVLGASPRGSHALYRAAQAQAALKNRDYVLPDDVKQLATVVLAHRCIIHPESALRGLSMDSIITGIVNDTALDIGKLT
ncbi:MAG TPA: MoxR family ATPase [Patescibacteria group bacterium]|nr:MoxR family ATPase [Patescibacteria group bacterium]